MINTISPKARTAIESKELIRPDWVNARVRDPNLLWLDKNENADPEFLRLVAKVYAEIAAYNLSSYPENARLYHKLAAKLGVDPTNLVFSAGSDGSIRAAFEAYIEPGDRVIYTQPTFAMYPVYAKIYGAKAYPLDYEATLDGPKLSVEILLDLIRTIKPKMLCLPNPDSPTGTVVAMKDLSLIIEEAGKIGSLVLIDEAYYPFYSETALPWISQYPHLLVTRSTGKAWGMAGFRLGYAVAQEGIIKMLQKVRSMYETNTIAFAMFERMLDFEDEMRNSVKRLEEGKQYFLNEMQVLGFKTLKAHGNFLHVNFGSHRESVHKALASLVYYRLNFDEPCLHGYSRFSSTTMQQFKLVVEAIKNAVI